MQRTTLKCKPKHPHPKPSTKHKPSSKHTVTGVDMRHSSSSPEAWSSSFVTCVRRLHADRCIPSIVPSPAPANLAPIPSRRLILSNIAGLPALSNAACSIGGVGATVGSGDEHAAELMGCKSIIKKMWDGVCYVGV